MSSETMSSDGGRQVRVTGIESQDPGVDACGRWVRKWPVGGLYEGSEARPRPRARSQGCLADVSAAGESDAWP